MSSIGGSGTISLNIVMLALFNFSVMLLIIPDFTMKGSVTTKTFLFPTSSNRSKAP